ncbi:hypothetical protein [Dysosmobacter welbionis]|uniref:hypothetical protein n=1 Tax=Dysosmobacter welbionis TaxID=2093857 RepID=UPI002942BAC0|nr:hypothetical protein [Dysosmobacter welbionis]
MTTPSASELLVQQAQEAERLRLLLLANECKDLIHTFPEWKRMGYSVKKGEKAAIKTRLWKYTTQPTKAAREAAELAGKEPDADPHYYLAPAYLFTAAQVQPTEDRKRKS